MCIVAHDKGHCCHCHCNWPSSSSSSSWCQACAGKRETGKQGSTDRAVVDGAADYIKKKLLGCPFPLARCAGFLASPLFFFLAYAWGWAFSFFLFKAKDKSPMCVSSASLFAVPRVTIAIIPSRRSILVLHRRRRWQWHHSQEKRVPTEVHT